ncbi:protein Dok-7-like [Sphaeramia orbicularis]|uniref:protein Dok-7-like n=1 Tax=Sphaeramia orbicularis TaxID=375764 RepID=UPI00117E7DD4|nr:protein Dok-7-like [Sphaeramia orbicularis]
MTDTVVAEGQVKFRDGKKWKTRWVVLRKPSPVADCLSLLVYKKKKKKGKEKGVGQDERLNVTLEGICGVEPGQGYDGISYTLSILCLAHTLVLGFHSREALLAWDARIRYSLGEVHRFSVNIEPGTKLESGPASLHLCNNLLVLTRGLPPVISGHWKLSALRRYGAVPSGFVFEGGTRCGYWAGVFFLSCSEGEQISFLFDCIVRGITPSRGPHGLQPALPADPNTDPASTEERISQEASELEKRLSRLSNCSLASSTASTYSCSTSVAGDDHSSVSSSSSSQSDTSYGSRLPFWVEPLARPHLSNETASSCSTLKALMGSEDRLYAAVTGSSRPSSAQLHHRGLHASGRQSSLDSGIGIATGSQSSYSGSFSSYTGSLDTGSQGGGEEFGSVASLPAPPPSVPPPPPTSPPPPPSSVQATLEHGPATSSSCPCASRCSSVASRRYSDEYQIPGMCRLRYDTPRSLLQTLSLREPSTQGALPDLSKDLRNSGHGGGSVGQWWSSCPTTSVQRQAMMQRSYSWGSERAPSVDSDGRSTPRSMLVPGCLAPGETQCSHGSDNYVTPEQWRSARNKCLTQVTNCASEPSSPAYERDAALCPTGEHDCGAAGNVTAHLETSMPCLPRPVPPALPVRPTAACSMFQTQSNAFCSVSLDTGLRTDNTVHYVNIPISPLLAKASRELLYTELDLQTPSSAPVSRLDSTGRGNTQLFSSSSQAFQLKFAFPPDFPEDDSIRYAHLDSTAMETAQRVGAEHIQGREDRLSQLESKLRGSPK